MAQEDGGWISGNEKQSSGGGGCIKMAKEKSKKSMVTEKGKETKEE